MLDKVESLTCVNTARIYATGVSNGGGMAALLGCTLALRLAAIAPVAGGYGSLPACRPSHPLPVLEVHGDADQVVPYAGRGPSKFGSVPAFLAQWRRINGCTSAPKMLPAPVGVTEMAWGACASGDDVVHDVIAHEPHSWPAWTRTVGSRTQYSTTWRTWSFFRGHRRGPGPVAGSQTTDRPDPGGVAPPQD